jgi:predicted phosphodiesterase
MTRIVIFGDLHANWAALLALQQAEPHPEVVFCLGDLVGYGPDPKLCLDSVRASATHLIGGRHDEAIGRKIHLAGNGNQILSGDDGLAEATWIYTGAVLSAADRAFLAGLPPTLTLDFAGIRFFLTRLKPDVLETEACTLITMPQARLRELFGQVEADLILVGGPHVPALRQFEGRLIVCPGSLGLPRYGVPDPTFAVWQDGRVQIHHLHYQPETTIRKVSLLPLEPEYGLRLQSILWSGGQE